jgi:hypothetical protein
MAEQLLVGLKALNQEIDKRDYENIEGLKAEISEEDYDFLLNVLPPVDWNGDTFYMSEFLVGDLTTKAYKKDGKYYAEVVDYRKEHPQIAEAEYRLLR